MRVLIVDDDPVTVRLLSVVLARDGYEVIVSRTGREALEVLRREDVRMVVTDWEMPEMDGLELCRTVRSTHSDSYVYLVMLTSNVSQEHIVAGLSAGADDFIAKPFNPAELLLRLRAGERILSLETRDLTLFAIAKLAESRDPDTGSHLERIRDYCRVLGAALSEQAEFRDEVTPAYIRLLYLTSPLHDIGKVAIPDFVLLKPGRLTEREFEIMKTHATAGAQTLEAALRAHPEAHYLRMARDIAAYHHEHFDGAGYPDGLTGDAIPLAARIVSLADVYDALTSKRVYKAELDHEVARSIILKSMNTQFDPRVVEAFLATESEFVAIHHRFARMGEDPRSFGPGQV